MFFKRLKTIYVLLRLTNITIYFVFGLHNSLVNTYEYLFFSGTDTENQCCHKLYFLYVDRFCRIADNQTVVKNVPRATDVR